MDDALSNPSDAGSTCCCGRMSLRKGVMILSTLTILFSILFIMFQAVFGALTPWWVWGGIISGIVGGLMGCCGSINSNWYKLVFGYLLWAMLLTLWWAIFVIKSTFVIYRNHGVANFWHLLWSLSLFLWTGYTCYVINAYYRSIKPAGSRWYAFGSDNPLGYRSME